MGGGACVCEEKFNGKLSFLLGRWDCLIGHWRDIRVSYRSIVLRGCSSYSRSSRDLFDVISTASIWILMVNCMKLTADIMRERIERVLDLWLSQSAAEVLAETIETHSARSMSWADHR